MALLRGMNVGTKEQKQKLLPTNNEREISEEKVQEKEVGASGMNTFLGKLNIGAGGSIIDTKEKTPLIDNNIVPKSATYTGNMDMGDTLKNNDIFDKKINENELNKKNNNKLKNNNNNNINPSNLLNNNNNKKENKTKKLLNLNKKINININKNGPKTWTKKYTNDDSNNQEVGWNELVNLQQLRSLGIITDNEYESRKQVLIDKMTGTKISQQKKLEFEKMLKKAQKQPRRRKLGEIEIIKQVPNWNQVDIERAIRHECKIVDNKEEWTQTIRMIQLAPNPFGNGTLRYVYYLNDLSENEENKNKKKSIDLKGTDLISPPPSTHVGKIAIDPMESNETYFYDVAMQQYANLYAKQFNKHNVPKKVGFLDCWVYELIERGYGIFCHVERHIVGDYNKYTNNWDWVNKAVERNTPSAFSHFTYEASKHKILICDLQGVNDVYTDPQMHTYNGKGCGKGNMGKRGISKFLKSHQCNAICTYLKLPASKRKELFIGTKPNQQYMDKESIEPLKNTRTIHEIPDTNIKTRTFPANTGTFGYNTKSNSNNNVSAFPKRLDDELSSKTGEKQCCHCIIL